MDHREALSLVSSILLIFKFDLSLVIAIIPDWARNYVIGCLSEGDGLNDLSVSRPQSRLEWGIRVPNDEQHTVRENQFPTYIYMCIP